MYLLVSLHVISKQEVIKTLHFIINIIIIKGFITINNNLAILKVIAINITNFKKMVKE